MRTQSTPSAAQLWPAFFATVVALLGSGCAGMVGEAEGGGGGDRTGTGPSGGRSGGAGTSGLGGGAGGAGGARAPGAGGSGAGTGGAAVPPDANAAGPLPLRRLTAREYLNTVRDLLGDTTLAPDDVPGESDDLSNNAFPFRQPSVIGTVEAGDLQGAAERLAKNMATKLSTVLPCTPANAGAEAGCAGQFISSFGTRAYRRPLAPAEITGLTALYQTGRTTLALDFNGAIGLLIEAMLQSPGFIYHWEMDPGAALRDGAVVQLGNYQVASRLSYFLWGTMPNPALFAAAAAGQLTTAAGVEMQVQRMLQDRKAEDTVADFVDDLLDVNVISSRPKDPAFYATWTPELAGAMEAELRSFSASTILGNGLFSELLTGTKSSVNQALAAVYGISGVTGTAQKAVTFDASQRGGVLTLAGFLAVTGATDGSSPVRRGHAVYTRLLCGTLPDPPNNVPLPQPPTAGVTTRQRFVEHDQNACTGGCHAAMDPIGFAFEHYDGIGKYRTTDQGLPVDSTGSVVLDGSPHAFTDAVSLGKLLAASPEAQACFARQWMRYAVNRWDTTADAASIGAAVTAFRTNLDVRNLVAGVALSRTFRFRAPAPGEVLP